MIGALTFLGLRGPPLDRPLRQMLKIQNRNMQNPGGHEPRHLQAR